MLSLLHIERIALIESADIAFGEGLNVLTGETGAGKSIVLDAISALMGERVSRDLIRTGEKNAFVRGIFNDLPQLSWFEEMGIFPDENGELMVSRQLGADGKNQCRVGGMACTTTQLKALGRQLINIHGQHDSQALLDETSHREYLDSFGDLEELRSDYVASYQKLALLRKSMDELLMSESEKSRRIDTLRFQIEELTSANLKLGEEESLLERRNMLRNSGKLLLAVEEAYASLAGDETSPGASSLLAEAEGAFSYATGMTKEMEEVSEELAELRYAAEDIGARVREMRELFEVSPGEQDEVEARLDVFYRLKKKYGETVEEMLSYLSASEKELAQIEMAEDMLISLQQDYDKEMKSAVKKGKALTKGRKEAGLFLQEKIEEELRQLDMPKVKFHAEIAEKKGRMMDETGLDDIQFLMSANVGEDLKPIQKVASGGELSRIMLAMKNVLAEKDTVCTLIFDEVDAGVSGRAAQKVAEKMGDLGRHRQLLCVTHLPQIAAMADYHFAVEKGERDERTHTVIIPLTPDERREELARLTGGGLITDAIRQGAAELLKQGEAYKLGHS